MTDTRTFPTNPNASFHLKGVKTSLFILSKCPTFTSVRCCYASHSEQDDLDDDNISGHRCDIGAAVHALKLSYLLIGTRAKIFDRGRWRRRDIS